jgi:hypothetical protein
MAMLDLDSENQTLRFILMPRKVFQAGSDFGQLI